MSSPDPCIGLAGPIAIVLAVVVRLAIRSSAMSSSSSRSERLRPRPRVRSKPRKRIAPKPVQEEMDVEPGWDEGDTRGKKAFKAKPTSRPTRSKDVW